MKRATSHLALAALFLLGSLAAHADSRHGHSRDVPAWSHRDDFRASDRGRRDWAERRNRDDSFGAHRGWSRGDFDRHDRWDYGDRHHHRGRLRGHDRHWRYGGRVDGYPGGGWHRDGYRNWRGGGYRDDGFYGDLQIVLSLPLW